MEDAEQRLPVVPDQPISSPLDNPISNNPKLLNIADNSLSMERLNIPHSNHTIPTRAATSHSQ